MFTTSADFVFASAAIAAIAVAVWAWGTHRRRLSPVEQDCMRRSMQAWTELQQRCITLVEEDESSGAEVEEFHRAVSRYHATIADPSDVLGRDLPMRDPKEISLLF